MPDQADALKIALKGAIALAQDVHTHPQAKDQFEGIYHQLASENAAAADLLQQLWEEYIAVQRSALFWQNMSDAEKDLAQKMTESNINLQQNYLRLVQEQ